MAIYYVDQTTGDDGDSGLTPALAWKTVDKVNGSAFSAGDLILFKCGEVWRETLTVPSSGSAGLPITFGCYGTGAKPKLLGSVDLIGAGAWAADTPGNSWETVFEYTPSDEYTTGGILNIRQIVPGHMIGCNGTKIRISVTASSTEDGVIGGSSIGVSTSVDDFDAAPTRITWNSGSNTVTVPANTTVVSDEITFTFTHSNRHLIHLYLTARNFKCQGTEGLNYQHWTEDDETLTTTVTYDAGYSPFVAKLEVYTPYGVSTWHTTSTLAIDVGNLIFNGEASVGVKYPLWADLLVQGDFYYDPATDLIHCYSASNPGTFYTAIEAVQDYYNIVAVSKNYVTIQNLDMRYCNDVAMMLVDCTNIIAEYHHLSYIGGRDLGGMERIGSGIATWNSAANITVRYNVMDQLLDNGFTSQGTGAGAVISNVIYHHNVVSNCEYGFEWFYGDADATADGIVVAHNVFYNNGGGWAHSQRYDPSGYGVCLGNTDITVTNCVVKNNIFHTSVLAHVRAAGLTDLDGWTFDHNDYYNGPAEPFMVTAGGLTYTFAEWQVAYSQDGHSLTTNPLVLNAAALDFHLRQDSPCRDRGISVAGIGQIEGGGQPDIGWDELISGAMRRKRGYRR